ncbi:MAG: type II secretion system F family protein [Kofleriaceae bacterium]|nr:type II secretion system F family protein [Kofleriaceae bacterium]
MGPEAIAPLAFVGVLSLALAVFLAWNARRTRAHEALVRRLGERTAEDARDGLMREEADGIARFLAESGLGWTPSELISRVGAAAVVGLLFGVALGSGALAFIFGLGGCLTMWILVRRTRARRLAQCDDQMPQALEIMALALRAGHALPGALQLAAAETPAPLCHELARAHEEHQLGRPIADVLAAMSARLPGCTSIDTFVVAVAVLQDTGGNLIAVIDRIVESARARAGYQTRLRALTAEGRQSARMLGALPVGFFFLALLSAPSHTAMLINDSGGRVILFVCIALWLTGLTWTRRLVRPLS